MQFKYLLKQALGNVKKAKGFYILIFLFVLICSAVTSSMIGFNIRVNNEIMSFNNETVNSVSVHSFGSVYKESTTEGMDPSTYSEMKLDIYNKLIEKINNDFGVFLNEKQIANWSSENFSLQWLSKQNNLNIDIQKIIDVSKNIEKYKYNYLWYFFQNIKNFESVFSHFVVTSNYDVLNGIYNNNGILNNIIVSSIVDNQDSLFYKSKSIYKPKVFEEISSTAKNQIYATPSFLSRYKLKLGNKIKLSINNSKQETEFTISGSMVDLDSIFERKFNAKTIYLKNPDNFFFDSNGFLNYPIYYAFTNKNSDNKFNSKILRDYFNNFFVNKNYDSVIDNFSTIKGIHSSLSKQKFVYNFLAICVWVLCAVLLIVMLGVAIAELAKSNKKIVIFLRSMGESKFKLSVLTMLTAMIPTSLAIILSNLLVPVFSEVLLQIYLRSINTVFTFWENLSIISVFVTLGLFAILISTYLVVNLIILNNDHLKVTSVQRPGHLELKLNSITSKIYRKNSKARISAAFVNHNFIKLVVSFVILTINLTIILFTVQFKFAGENVADSVISNNAPYVNSVMINNKLTDINGNLDGITTTKDKYEKIIGSNNKLFSDFYFINSLKGQNFIDDMESKEELHKNDINKTFINGEQLLMLLTFHKDIFETNIDNDFKFKYDLTRYIINITRTYIPLLYTKLGIDNIKKATITFGDRYINNFDNKADSISSSNFAIDVNVNMKSSTIIKTLYGISPNSAYKIDFSSTNYDNAFYDLKQKDGSYKKILNVDVSYSVKFHDSNLKVGSIVSLSDWSCFNTQKMNPSIEVRINSIVKKDLYDVSFYVNKRALMEVIYNSGLLNLSENQFESMKENDFADLNNYYRSTEKIPFALLNSNVPYLSGDGNNLIDYGDGVDKNLLNLYTPKIVDYEQLKNEINEDFGGFLQTALKITYVLMVILIIVTCIVSAIILIENASIILMLKTMGYKLNEVIFKLLFGYIASVALASIVASVASFLMISFMTDLFMINLGIAFVFVNNVFFYAISVIINLIFAFIITWAAIVTWRATKPNKAFDSLSM